jgi:hypothetical protein
MKFKQLLSKIESLQENAPEQTFEGGLYIGDPGKGSVSALTNKGTFNLKLPYSIDAINAMLGAFSSKDYIDPSEMMAVVKQKLNHFGLDFDFKNCTKDASQDGAYNYHLVQYASPQLGVYGQNPYDDVNKKGFKQGDGIKEKLGHGLALQVRHSKESKWPTQNESSYCSFRGRSRDRR